MSDSFDSQAPHSEQPPSEGVIAIPYQQLSAETLQAIIESFIHREGTDYGEYEVDLATKTQQVLALLQQGKAHILFDPIGQDCQIVMKEQLAGFGL